MSKFKEGDRVVIARFTQGFHFGWTSEMRELIGDGKEYVVRAVSPGVVRIANDRYDWAWPIEAFDHAEPGLFDYTTEEK